MTKIFPLLHKKVAERDVSNIEPDLRADITEEVYTVKITPTWPFM